MTKLIPMIFCVAVAGTLFAQDDAAEMRDLKARMAALEKKNQQGSINPSARAEVQGGWDLFIYGDLLIWQAHEANLPIAVKNKDMNFNLDNASGKNLEFDWDLGFRVGLGYNLPHDGWDLNLTWLRLHSEAHHKLHVANGQILWGSQEHPLDGSNGFVNIPARWHAQLNQIDLDLGREFYVGRFLTLRPHVGLRNTWLRQKLKVNYKEPVFLNTDELEIRKSNHWWGIGPEAGLDTQWMIGAGFSIYGNFTAAIEYGFHKVKNRDEDETIETDLVKFHDSFRVSHPILDMQLGMMWDQMFYRDRFHVGLHAGWEQHIYFSQNQFAYFIDDTSIGAFTTNNGDLTYQGWTVGARFDF